MTEENHPTENNSPNESGWVECPSGEITGMINRVSHQRKLVASARFTVIATALMIGAALWQTPPVAPRQVETPDSGYQFGSICCSDVSQYAAAFHKGELDEEKTAQIRQHIAKCPHCGPEFEKLAKEPQASINRQNAPISTASQALSGLLVATR